MNTIPPQPPGTKVTIKPDGTIIIETPEGSAPWVPNYPSQPSIPWPELPWKPWYQMPQVWC